MPSFIFFLQKLKKFCISRVLAAFWKKHPKTGNSWYWKRGQRNTEARIWALTRHRVLRFWKFLFFSFFSIFRDFFGEKIRSIRPILRKLFLKRIKSASIPTGRVLGVAMPTLFGFFFSNFRNSGPIIKFLFFGFFLIVYYFLKKKLGRSDHYCASYF